MPDTYTPQEMLAKLVSFPTVSRESNLELMDFVEDYLNGHGVSATRVYSDNKQKCNLYACVGPQEAAVNVTRQEFLTVEQTAAVCGIGRTSAYQLARRAADHGDGDFPAVRFGKQLRIPRRKLEHLIGGPITLPTDPRPPPEPTTTTPTTTSNNDHPRTITPNDTTTTTTHPHQPQLPLTAP